MTIRERTPFDVLWQVIGAASLLTRLVLSFALGRQSLCEPGAYRCTSCGNAFTVLF